MSLFKKNDGPTSERTLRDDPEVGRQSGTQTILTTPARVHAKLAQGYTVVDDNVPGSHGEQFVRMSRPCS